MKSLFTHICEENYNKIYKYIWSMTNNKTQAEDLTQEVFLIAYEKGEKFLAHKNQLAFLYTTAKNVTFSEFRRQKKENSVSLDELNEVIEQNDAYESLRKSYDESIDESVYVPIVLDTLTLEKKDLYNAYYVEHKPMRKIACEMGVSEVSLRMKYVRLRREIKSTIKNLQLN